jgi:hypothetical protein
MAEQEKITEKEYAFSREMKMADVKIECMKTAYGICTMGMTLGHMTAESVVDAADKLFEWVKKA